LIASKEDAPFEDFWSEDSDVMERVRHWLERSGPLLSLSERGKRRRRERHAFVRDAATTVVVCQEARALSHCCST
jgi:hypothetical protein